MLVSILVSILKEVRIFRMGLDILWRIMLYMRYYFIWPTRTVCLTIDFNLTMTLTFQVTFQLILTMTLALTLTLSLTWSLIESANRTHDPKPERIFTLRMTWAMTVTFDIKFEPSRNHIPNHLMKPQPGSDHATKRQRILDHDPRHDSDLWLWSLHWPWHFTLIMTLTLT